MRIIKNLLMITILTLIVTSCKSETVQQSPTEQGQAVEHTSTVELIESTSEPIESQIHILESTVDEYWGVLYSPDQQKFVATDKEYDFNTILVQQNGFSEVIFDFKQFYGEGAVRDMYLLDYVWKDTESLYIINKNTDPYGEFLEINVTTKEILRHRLLLNGYILNYDAASKYFFIMFAEDTPARSYALYSHQTNENIPLPDFNNLYSYIQNGSKHIFVVPSVEDQFYSEMYSEELPEGQKKVVIYDLATNEVSDISYQDDQHSSIYVYQDKPYFAFIVKEVLYVVNYQTKEDILQLDISNYENIKDYNFISLAVQQIPQLRDL